MITFSEQTFQNAKRTLHIIGKLLLIELSNDMQSPFGILKSL